MFCGYKSEVGAVCSAVTAVVCLIFTPRRYLAAGVVASLFVQRLIARGSMNRCRPPSIHSPSPRGPIVFSRNMPDSHRPVAIVTGTNSGIGFHTAVGLAAEGYRVVCTCRTAALSAAAAVNIRNAAHRHRHRRDDSEVPETVLVDGRFFFECDDFASVRRFAEGFQAAYDRLDVLVNNAGMMQQPQLEFSRHDARLELHTAVNFLGPLLLTELLVPLVRQSHGRVVYVASEAHRCPQMVLEPLWGSGGSGASVGGRLLDALRGINNGAAKATGPLAVSSLRNAFVRYGTSKLLNTYHAHYIARHYDIPACSLHPGCVSTNFSRDLFAEQWMLRIYQYVSLLFLKTSYEGAQTTLHCAICDVDELKMVKSSNRPEAVSPYFVECRNQTQQSLMRYGWDVEEADRIVHWGKEILGLTKKD